MTNNKAERNLIAYKSFIYDTCQQGTTAGGNGVYHTPLRASSKPNGQSSEDGTTNSGEIINFEIQELPDSSDHVVSLKKGGGGGLSQRNLLLLNAEEIKACRAIYKAMVQQRPKDFKDKLSPHRWILTSKLNVPKKQFLMDQSAGIKLQSSLKSS